MALESLEADANPAKCQFVRHQTVHRKTPVLDCFRKTVSQSSFTRLIARGRSGESRRETAILKLSSLIGDDYVLGFFTAA
jgi:hypothetical protein